MNLDTFNWLLTPAGQALLAEAAAGDLGDAGRLRALERLRRIAAPAQAAAAYEQALLRRRALAKFSQAGRMYFVREALEQASGEVIAGYRARRYQPYARVAELCCGIGGDTLALAGGRAKVGGRQSAVGSDEPSSHSARRVLAFDHDELRLALAAANARALGLAARIDFAHADVAKLELPQADAIFFDPARRSVGKRVFSLAGYQPSLDLIGGWQARVPAIGVKAAPGIADDELAALAARLGRPALEAEFISVDGELKEAALWFGPLAIAERRATVIRSEHQEPRTENQTANLCHLRNLWIPECHQPASSTSVGWWAWTLARTAGALVPRPPLAVPLAYLYEPDPAVIRAHLVAELAVQLGAAQIDWQIAYLTADHALDSPFARCWHVLEWHPFNLKRLRARLRALDAGAVTVKKRGSPLDTDALARQLSGNGLRALVVVLTNVADRPATLICEGPI